MKNYLGTKAIKATPMNLSDYNDLRNWILPDDQNGADEGYLIEYTDGGAPNHQGYAGYITWTSKAQFDATYRETSGLNFGLAIEAMRGGSKVAREGWNGKGMWITLSGLGGKQEVAAGSFWCDNNAKFAHAQGGKAVVQPCFTMKTAADEIQMGWLASQSDMLAEDWAVVA